MKIAIDVTPLSTGHQYRGTGSYTDNLVKALQKYDKQNLYYFFEQKRELPKDIDLVHYPYFEPFFLSLPLRKQTKTMVTIHDLIPLVLPDHFPAGIKGKLKWQIQKNSLKTVKAILTDSQSSKKDIVRLTGTNEEKIHVIYLAPGEEFRKINDTERLQGVRIKYQLPDKFVLYVGDVTWNKNLPRLIEAIKIINIPLVMVGKIFIADDFDKNNLWNHDLIKVQKQAKNDPRIRRTGFVPKEDLVAIYNLATVFAMPSIYEGFGLPVLEAMACGCPVVTSKTSSLPEICGEAAILVDPYNMENLAKAIEKVVKDNKERDRLVEKGITQASRFNWEKTARETREIYKKIHEQT